MGHTGTGNCICKELPFRVNAECSVAGHSREVTSVAMSADGKRIVSGSGDTLVKIWDAATGAVVSPSRPLGSECSQHRRTPRPSVGRVRRKALLPFGPQ